MSDISREGYLARSCMVNFADFPKPVHAMRNILPFRKMEVGCPDSHFSPGRFLTRLAASTPRSYGRLPVTLVSAINLSRVIPNASSAASTAEGEKKLGTRHTDKTVERKGGTGGGETAYQGVPRATPRKRPNVH